MPQNFFFGLGAYTASPIEGSAMFNYHIRFYDRFYSDWSATSREYSDGDTPDRKFPWHDSILWYS